MGRCVIIVLSVLLSVSTAHAAVLRVEASAVPGGDGSSWALAFATLEDALAAAADGDELWIAADTYVPADTSFEIGANVTLYGGFAGTETSLAQRDVDANPTILSGDVNGDDGPEFTNRDDNVGSILFCFPPIDSLTVDGFTITGGDAETGGGIFGTNLDLLTNLDIVVRSCRFTENRASFGGAIHFEDASVTLADCVFAENEATRGGAINAEHGTEFTIERCSFEGNRAVNGAGGAIRLLDQTGAVDMRDCTFFGQEAEAGGGAVFLTSVAAVTIDRCQFAANASILSGGGGLWVSATPAVVSRCVFAENDGPLLGGGLAAGRDVTVIGCVFSRNNSGAGGGIYSGSDFGDTMTVVNCSLSGNTGGAIATSAQKNPIVVRNSIIWGNTPDAFWSFIPPGPLSDTQADVSDSIVQGGHPGSNVLDMNPLFRAPGLDDLRLTAGSPALDAGDNAHLPPGFDDVDLDGAPRIQNGIVDLGAYEGVAEGSPAPAVTDSDIDEGDSAILAPLADGPVFSPMEFAGLIAMNETGGDNGAMTVAQPEEDPYPGAGGYRSVSDVLDVETTIVAGAFVARLTIPFDADDLNGLNPVEMDITVYDPTTDTWALAVSANVDDPAPIGTRYAVVSESNPFLNFVPGDYGVYWRPSEQRGFAWANVNHTSTFGVGVPRCRADAAQPPNGSIGFDDLMTVLAAWGTGAGPADVVFDGDIGLADVTALLQAWGACNP